MKKVKILLDSVSAEGKRLVTFEIEFARIVLAETVTHKILSQTDEPVIEYLFPSRTSGTDISKSSASSRAVPFQKMAEKCRADPFIPNFSINQAGMQEAGFLEGEKKEEAETVWLSCMNRCLAAAAHLHEMGVHKQDINRLIEPFSWVKQVVTGTEWNNFFALRCHEAAHPEFRDIARAMYVAYSRSTPILLKPGEWHLPYITIDDWGVAFAMAADKEKRGEKFAPWFSSYGGEYVVRWSAARCARTSYRLHDGKPASPEEDERLYQRLCGGRPVHSEPFSHQATPWSDDWGLDREKYRSNLSGWLQHRKLIPGETTHVFNPSAEEVASWKVPESIFS